MVSIILPVKDEADTLRESLGSLLGLDYPLKEIIVVSGNSDDGTDKILREFESRVRIVSEGARPEGWRGKCWACHRGFLNSAGEVLLFTDGDVTHRKNSLSSSLAYMESDRASLVSVWPEVVTRVPAERMLFPVGAFFLSAGLAARATKKTPRGTIIRGANGQYMLVSREAYVAVGGHAGVRGSIIEDGALGRNVADSGRTVRNLDGRGFASVRPYASLREIWAAFERFSAGLLPRFRSLLSVEVLSFLYFTLPVILLAAGVVTNSLAVIVVGASACTAAHGTILAFYRKHSHVAYAPLAPLAGLVMMAAFARGYARFRRRGVEWKGSLYREEDPTAPGG